MTSRGRFRSQVKEGWHQQDKTPARRKGILYCARCGCRLNSFNHTELCAPCRQGARERRIERQRL
jgi:hypothetical protein